MAYTTAQLLGALLTVDGRANEGGVIDIPPGARLLLDVVSGGQADGDFLNDLDTAVTEAKAARDEAVQIAAGDISTTISTVGTAQKWIRGDGVPRVGRATGDGIVGGAIDLKHTGGPGYLIHLTGKTGAGSNGYAALLAIGTDNGDAAGILVSHKRAGQAGIHAIAHGGAGVGVLTEGWNAGWTSYTSVGTGGAGVFTVLRSGQGFGDGVTTQGSTTFTSATAAFTAGDVGAAITQTTTTDGPDPAGSIPAGATIVAVASATSVTLSAPAAFTGTSIRFRVAGRVPTDTQLLHTWQDEADKSILEVRRGSVSVRRPMTMTGTEGRPGDSPLSIVGVTGQTAELFSVRKLGDGSGALSVTSGGIVAARQGASISNAGNASASPLTVTNSGGTGITTATIRASATQGSNQLALQNSASSTITRFDKNNVLMTRAAVPADADLTNGEVALWFDATTGAAKVMFKAKDAGGTVRTGQVALA